MTTIIYSHNDRQIAVDSRETAGDEIKSDQVKKYYLADGDVYFIAGATHSMDDFVASPKERGFKPAVEIDCCAIIVRDGKVFKGAYSEEIGYWEIELSYSDAIGSGGIYALCAVSLGKSAIDAVEFAKTKDVNTGGDVVVYDIARGEFI